MEKDLTASKLDRQNILNNEMALKEIEKNANIDGVFYTDCMFFTKEMAASFFEVDTRTIERYITAYSDELKSNGYQILRGARLKGFLNEYKKHFGTDINVGTKTTVLGVFSLRAFLDLAMMLSESENARVLRQVMLDIVIDLINKKTGGSTRFINQRAKDFVGSYLQEENYRKEFTDALCNYIDMGNFKYALYTDKIYQSIFKEKAKEYREVLKLQKSDKVRDTLYSEILNLIASYECGLAKVIQNKSEELGRKLNNWELSALFDEFENLPHWKPLLESARTKMASRDLGLRDAFHQQLEKYIQPLEKQEYEKFLGKDSSDIEKLMQENKDVLKRLKDRE
ncbi:MAG: DNA-binding protein [Treponema sp. CETP13]|nr:MAG: DNA-binding protein [Treponema sp. CETP13]